MSRFVPQRDLLCYEYGEAVTATVTASLILP